MPHIFRKILEPEAGSLPWYKNVDPNMTYQVLDEMADEFAGIYRECKDNLALTRFASKGIVQPSRGRQGSPSDKGPILPPPPPPPTFHKRVDISEYKERSKAASTSLDHSISSGRPGIRKSFMPDTSQVRADISMSHPSLLNQEPLSLALQTVMNGRKEDYSASISRREEEKRRDKERERRKEDREERDRRRDERPEDRERKREEERRKREHDRISGHCANNSYVIEKRTRSDLSNSFVPSSMVNLGNAKVRSTTQVTPVPTSISRCRERDTTKISSRYSGASATSRRPSSPIASRSEIPRALSPPPQPPVVLSPPPPPPLYAELEDGELE